MQTKQIAIITEKQQIKKPQKSPYETCFTVSSGAKSDAMAGNTIPLIVEPKRAMQSVIPKANESSFPLNHCDTIAL